MVVFVAEKTGQVPDGHDDGAAGPHQGRPGTACVRAGPGPGAAAGGSARDRARGGDHLRRADLGPVLDHPGRAGPDAGHFLARDVRDRGGPRGGDLRRGPRRRGLQPDRVRPGRGRRRVCEHARRRAGRPAALGSAPGGGRAAAGRADGLAGTGGPRGPRGRRAGAGARRRGRGRRLRGPARGGARRPGHGHRVSPGRWLRPGPGGGGVPQRRGGPVRGCDQRGGRGHRHRRRRDDRAFLRGHAARRPPGDAGRPARRGPGPRPRGARHVLRGRAGRRRTGPPRGPGGPGTAAPSGQPGVPAERGPPRVRERPPPPSAGQDRADRAVSGPPAVPGSEDGLVLASPQGRWVLLATVLGSAVASIDATVVGIALPAIGRDVHVGLAALQWVVTAYTMTLAGLLLLAGSLGDKYGRKKVFLIGVIWFAVASLLCSVAPSATILILARAVQGVGAALLTPGSLAILEAVFRPDDRGKAIGAWSGYAGVGTAIGPFIGGYLVQAVSWRLIFVINLPLAALVVAVSLRHVPESRDPEATGRIDVPGGALVTLGLIALTYGLIEGPGGNWPRPAVLAALLGGIALLGAFVWQEQRMAAPMLPLSLVASTQFTATNLITFVVYGGIGGALFLLPIELQQVSGYTALEAGISLLPVTAITLVLSRRSGALAARIGPRLQMSVGPVLVGLGLALFTRITASGDYVTEVLPAVLVFGFGLAVTVAPLTSTVLDAVPAEHAGIASAVNNDVARAAALIAVALLPAAGGITGDAYRHADVFSAGFHTASLISGALCVAGGVLAVFTIRNPARVAGASRQAAPVHCALDAPPAAVTTAGPVTQESRVQHSPDHDAGALG